MPTNMILRVVLPVAAFFATTAVFAQDIDEELAEVREKITAKFDVIAPEDVVASPVDGWYTVRKGSIVAYVSADARYLLQGDLIDLDTNVNMSEAARNESRRSLMAQVSDDEVIAFAPADPQYSVAVFTDVECTYCRRLHSQIDEYLAHGIEIRYLMYPRNGPTSEAWNTAEDVWCSNDRNAALTAAKSDRKFASSDCDVSIVEEQYALGQDVGLTGTPAIVLSDGSLISGYLPPAKLKARLDQEAAQP